MKKTAIVTDSTADLPPELAASNNIFVIPLKVIFDEDEYLDGVTIKHDEFISKMNTPGLFPRTSQPSPGEFLALYKKLIDQGYENILSLHISYKLSGTINSANMAKMMTKNANIRIIDTLTTSLGLGLAALRATSLLKTAANIDELEKTIKSELNYVEIFFTVKTLDFLSKNGRIGKAQAFVGNLLKLKPILALQDGLGEIVPIKKVKGTAKVVDEIISLILLHYSKNKCITGIGIVQSCMKDEAEYMRRILEEKTDNVEIISSTVGCVIGSHVGPEVIGAGIY